MTPLRVDNLYVISFKNDHNKTILKHIKGNSRSNYYCMYHYSSNYTRTDCQSDSSFKVDVVVVAAAVDILPIVLYCYCYCYCNLNSK